MRVPAGVRVKFSDWDAADRGIIGKDKSEACVRLDDYRARLETLQELLYAEGKNKLLIVLQAMDTAGKDSTIRHVFRGVDPLGVTVTGLKTPSLTNARATISGACIDMSRVRAKSRSSINPITKTC